MKKPTQSVTSGAGEAANAQAFIKAGESGGAGRLFKRISIPRWGAIRSTWAGAEAAAAYL